MMQSVIGLLVILLFAIGFLPLLDRAPVFLALYSFGFVFSVVTLSLAVSDLSGAYVGAYDAAKAAGAGAGPALSAQLHQIAMEV